MNIIAHGDMTLEDDASGISVAVIREYLRDALSIHTDATPFIDGRPAGPDAPLPPDAELRFVRLNGRKGVGEVWTPDQFCKVMQCTREDLDQMVRQGLRVLVLGDGEYRITETAVDVFIEAGGHVPPTAGSPAEEPGPQERPAAVADLTPIQAAAEIGCSRSQVYKLVRAGELAYRRVGRGYRVTRASVAEYKRRHSAEARPPAPPATTGYRFKHL